MILGKVKGNIESTIKHPAYVGYKILIIQPITKEGKEKGDSFLACDPGQAGPGDIVIASREGNTARQLLGSSSDPFHAVVLGIVDDITCA